MKVLVLGAGGMAGHVVATYLSESGHDVSTVSARNKLDKNTVLIDATDTKELDRYLSENSFDIVINCIGVLVKQSEEHKHLSSHLNAYLPHHLVDFYKNKKTRIIHLSTDCVFSGLNAPYYENSPYDGQPFYDRSKALGEIINDKDLTLRMSIIGPDMQPNGIGLFNWFYKQKGEINGFRNAVWNGVTTIELAKGIEKAMEQNLTGLYHFTSTQSISKFELLKLFTSAFEREDITVKPIDTVALDKTLLSTRNDFLYTIPMYETMINEMKEWIEEHKHLYDHYL